MSQVPCPPGYYCPRNSSQPVKCPPGHYCDPKLNCYNASNHEAGACKPKLCEQGMLYWRAVVIYYTLYTIRPFYGQELKSQRKFKTGGTQLIFNLFLGYEEIVGSQRDTSATTCRICKPGYFNNAVSQSLCKQCRGGVICLEGKFYLFIYVVMYHIW
jgi:hypothetical protein